MSDKREYADYPGRTWGQRMDDDYQALLRVARLVKAWINLYNDGPLPNFASWQEAVKEIEDALKDVKHLL